MSLRCVKHADEMFHERGVLLEDPPIDDFYLSQHVILLSLYEKLKTKDFSDQGLCLH